MVRFRLQQHVVGYEENILVWGPHSYRRQPPGFWVKVWGLLNPSTNPHTHPVGTVQLLILRHYWQSLNLMLSRGVSYSRDRCHLADRQCIITLWKVTSSYILTLPCRILYHHECWLLASGICGQNHWQCDGIWWLWNENKLLELSPGLGSVATTDGINNGHNYCDVTHWFVNSHFEASSSAFRPSSFWGFFGARSDFIWTRG